MYALVINISIPGKPVTIGIVGVAALVICALIIVNIVLIWW